MSYDYSTADLRTPISVYAPSTSGTGINKSTTYTKVIDARCRWVNAHGREGMIADSKQTARQATITMRYHPSVNRACQIDKDGERWELITEPDNIRERGMWLQFKVQVVSSG